LLGLRSLTEKATDLVAINIAHETAIHGFAAAGGALGNTGNGTWFFTGGRLRK